jgi:hypothetical protein
MSFPGEPSSLDYFSGGVPTGATFRIIVGELRALSETSETNDPSPGINRIQELCFIGLMSYFEAFCKDHFASLINIEPSLILNLKRAGQSVEVDLSRVLLFGERVNLKMGFLVAEKFDFGTAQKINTLFLALLKLSPFSKDESKQYADLLADRNLLVHHGGTYTLTYLEQARASQEEVKQHAYYNSHVKARKDVVEAIDFLEGIAKKMLGSSHSALVQHLADSQIEYSGERQKALEYILWWD